MQMKRKAYLPAAGLATVTDGCSRCQQPHQLISVQSQHQDAVRSATGREEILHAQGLLFTLFTAWKRNTQARTALHSLHRTCRVLLLLQPSWVRGCCFPNHSMCCHFSRKITLNKASALGVCPMQFQLC